MITPHIPPAASETATPDSAQLQFLTAILLQNQDLIFCLPLYCFGPGQ